MASLASKNQEFSMNKSRILTKQQDILYILASSTVYRNFLFGNESIHVINSKVRYEGVIVARILCLPKAKTTLLQHKTQDP